jgi:biotin carboxyl carrier protein
MSENKHQYIASCQKKGCKYTFTTHANGTLKIGRKKSDLKFVIDEEGFTWIESGEKRFIAEVVEKSQNRYHVVVNGNSYQLAIDTPFSFKRRKFLSQLAKGNKKWMIDSPMPGKIVEVLVNEGDTVTVGDTLLILEAMKMQNEILAEVSGTVAKVHVKAGQNVMKDEHIMEIGK